MAKSGRYSNMGKAAEGWAIRRAVAPSRLIGANGLRAREGRLYVAQVAGSQISAIDPDSGEIETISPVDGPVVSPDDLAFDDDGNIYATEITAGRIGMLTPKGEYRVLNGDMPVANPITFHQGTLIAGECRPGGKVGTIDRDSGAFSPILTDVPMPNAFEVGPDEKLYMPIMGTNEIWRVGLDGGEPEVVMGDLGVPDSLKFDSKGRIVSTQVATGQVLRIDVQTGEREVLAQLSPGLDNVAFVDDRIFVSSIPGEIVEILEPGKTRPLVERGLQWPMGLACGPDGTLFVADGGFTYTLGQDGLDLLGMLFSPRFPGFTRGVAAAGAGEWVVTTSNAQVARWRPEAQEMEIVSEGHDVLYGVAVAPDGAVVFADGEAGRVLSAKGGSDEELASGLKRPMGVAIGGDGTVYVGESEGGRVVKLSGGKIETVLDGLIEPQGIAVVGDRLYALDVMGKELVECDLGTGARRTIASDLPVKAAPGVTPKLLGGVGNMSGPMVPFAGIAVAPDGTIYIAGDAEGSVIAVQPG